MSQIINYISFPSIFLFFCHVLSRRKHGNREWVLLRNIRNKKRLSLELPTAPQTLMCGLWAYTILRISQNIPYLPPEPLQFKTHRTLTSFSDISNIKPNVSEGIHSQMPLQFDMPCGHNT